MRYTIVKFKDGTYGYRKFSLLDFGYVYLDLASRGQLWWATDTHYFVTNCRGTLQEVIKKVNKIEDMGEPIDAKNFNT